MRSADVVETTREQIVARATRLFGARGIGATSLREVARDAGVSPALVVHHFGGKEGLVAAVDEAALQAFGEAYREEEVPPGPEVLQRRAEQTAAVMRERPEVCAYLGRALVEVTPGAARLFELMISSGRDEIERLVEAGAVRADADRGWATLQHFFLIWAPLSFRHLLEDGVVGGPLLEGENLDRWVEANIELLRRGLYR
jgi:TetR/AcrR family transcriptional regulator, regulator of cefoperazone and chloramphenicol sensitivity